MALMAGDSVGGTRYRGTAQKRKPAVRSRGSNSFLKGVGISGIRAVPRGSSSNRGVGGGSGGGRTYNRRGGGGWSGVGGNSSGRIAPKAPKPPSLKDYLGTDSTYMQQSAALQKAKQDYLAQQGQSRTQYETNYAGDLDTLKTNRTQSLGDLENDYAGRGLLQSGLYADSMSDMNTDYDKRTSALEQAKAAFLAQMAGDLTNFTSEQGLTLTKAQQEAAARRAAKYGV